MSLTIFINYECLLMEHDYDCLIVFLMKDITLFRVINFPTNNKSSRNGCHLEVIHVSNFCAFINKFISKPFENVMYFHWKCWDYGGSSILQLTRCTVSPTSWTMRDFCIIFLRKWTKRKFKFFFFKLYFIFSISQIFESLISFIISKDIL